MPQRVPANATGAAGALFRFRPARRRRQCPAGRISGRQEMICCGFGGGENIAVILGPASGELVDSDLDCPEALALADLYLPPTRAVFGRGSKPRSHRLFIAPGAVYESFADPLTGNTLIELRAAGRDGGAHLTLFPPSIADGERREWDGEVIAPAVVDAAVLRTAAAWLRSVASSCGTFPTMPRSGRDPTCQISSGRPIRRSAVAPLTGSACPIPTRRDDTRDCAAS
jgi:hypothetical protein